MARTLPLTPSTILRIFILPVLFALLARGVSGQGWARLGPEGGMVISLAADIGGRTLYLGTSDGHIFASRDRGASWKLQGRVDYRTDAVVAQLAVSPEDPDRVFAAVWFQEAGAGGFVFRSDDGGTTWRASGLQGEAVRALEFAPSQPRTLIAGTRSGVFRSSDAGKTWERLSPPGDPELRNVDSVAVDPANPLLIYAGTYHLPWKTVDGGKTWKPVTAGLIDDSDIMSMRVDAADPARLYLSACSGIYRSENRGEAWTKLQGIPYAARRTQAIVQDPEQPATLYAATTEGLWVTRDSGESWERTTPRDWVVNGVALLPPGNGSSSRVVIGTEAQGLLVSDDAGKNFAESNRGFTHQVARQLVSDPNDGSHLLLVLERGGVELLESRDAGKSWIPLATPAAKGREFRDWSAYRIDRIYGSPWGWMVQLSNSTFWLTRGANTDWHPWVAAVAPMPQMRKKGTSGGPATAATKVATQGALVFSKDKAYLPALQGVVPCNESGKCESPAAFSKAGPPSMLWVSSDDRVIGVVSGGKLGLSQDFGKSASWHDLPAGLSSANAMLWDDAGHSTLFFATNRGLFYSKDAATHWTPVQGGLPAGVVTDVRRTSQGVVAVIEQAGVYVSADAIGNWSRLDQDAERGRINGLVETGPHQLLFGSQSEGLLQWDGPAHR
jgi:photosystem II stability/assembly factor-like uncharacterized protein